jgi:hypothetical protein
MTTPVLAAMFGANTPSIRPRAPSPGTCRHNVQVLRTRGIVFVSAVRPYRRHGQQQQIAAAKTTKSRYRVSVRARARARAAASKRA